MSWDGYIDSVVGRCAADCDKVAIIGLNGGVWTSMTHQNALRIQPQEALAIGTALSTKNFSPLQGGGVVVEGIKYRFLRVEDDTIISAKMKDLGALTIQKTKTAAVIGHTIEGKSVGNVNVALASICDYLESVNM